MHSKNTRWEDSPDQRSHVHCAPSNSSLRVEYRLIRKLGEGTFSEVLKAQSVQTGQYVAIKCMKSHFDSIDQVCGVETHNGISMLSPTFSSQTLNVWMYRCKTWERSRHYRGCPRIPTSFSWLRCYSKWIVRLWQIKELTLPTSSPKTLNKIL